MDRRLGLRHHLFHISQYGSRVSWQRDSTRTTVPQVVLTTIWCELVAILDCSNSSTSHLETTESESLHTSRRCFCRKNSGWNDRRTCHSGYRSSYQGPYRNHVLVHPYQSRQAKGVILDPSPNFKRVRRNILCSGIPSY